MVGSLIFSNSLNKILILEDQSDLPSTQNVYLEEEDLNVCLVFTYIIL